MAEQQQQPAHFINNDEEFNVLKGKLESGEISEEHPHYTYLLQEGAAYVARREKAKTDNFLGMLNTSPMEGLPEPSQPRDSISLPGGMPQRRGEDHPTTLINNAASAGVDIKTGLNPEMREIADLLYIDPQAKIDAMDYLVRKDLRKRGFQVPDSMPMVYEDPYSGRLAYFRAGEDGSLRPTLVNPPGFDTGDLRENLDDVLGVTAETAVGLGAAAGTGGVGLGAYSATAGASVAVGGANMVANELRKWAAKDIFGIPESIVEQVDNDDMFDEALTAAGFEMLGPLISGIIRRGANTLSRTDVTLTGDELEAVKERIREVKQLSDDIFEATGARIIPTLSAATGDPALMVMERNARAAMVNKKAAAVTEEEIRNSQATAEAIRAIHEGTVPSGPMLDIPQNELAEKARRTLRAPVEEAEREATVIETGFRDLADEVDSVWDIGPFEDLRTDMVWATDQVGKLEEVAWDAYRASVETGPDGVAQIMLRNGQDSPIRTAIAGLQGSSAQALSETIAKSNDELVARLGYAPAAVRGQRMDALALDGNQLHVLLSHLKHEETLLRNNASKLNWDPNKLREVIGAIETQMSGKGWARRGQGGVLDPNPLPEDKLQTIHAAYELANDATTLKHNMYSTKGVMELMEQTPLGDWVMPPDGIRALVFKPNDSSALVDVMRVVGGNPHKRDALLDELDKMYKANVFMEGKWSPTQHNAFMNAYRNHLNLLTGGRSDSYFIRNSRDFGNMLKEAQENTQRVTHSLSKIYGRELTAEDMYGGNLVVDMINGKMPPSQIKAVKAALSGRAPELWNSIQQAGLDSLESRMLKTSKSEASLSGMSKLIEENYDRLSAIYGPEYARNLMSLRSMMQVIASGDVGKKSRTQLNTPALQAMRTLFGPLSPIQRRITAGLRISDGNQNRKVMAMIADPERLEDFLRIARMSPMQAGYFGAMSNIFGPAVAETMRIGMGIPEHVTDARPQAREKSEAVRRVHQLNAQRRATQSILVE